MIKIDLKRYEDQIETLETRPLHNAKIMLYGSSLFANWGHERSHQALSGLLNTENSSSNHGFGGATVDELLYYYPRLVRPYKPEYLVIRSGVNDLSNGYTAEETMTLLTRLTSWYTNDFPNGKIILIPIFDFPNPDFRTHHYIDNRNKFNALCQTVAAEHQFSLLDLNPFVHEHAEDFGTTQGFRDIFIEDGLHLTDDGYEQFGAFMRHKLSEILER